MSAVEDTREARERKERLLAEVAAGVIVRTLRAELPYARRDKERQAFPLGATEQQAMAELRQRDLIAIDPGADLLRAVVLTDKGRAVLGAPAATNTGLPAVPPLLCESVVHGQNPPPGVVVCMESTGEMRRMVQCADCAPSYAAAVAAQFVAQYGRDPSAPPAAVYVLPLPQAWTGT